MSLKPGQLSSVPPQPLPMPFKKGVTEGRASDQHCRDDMKSEPGPPMTLGAAAAAGVS